MVLSCLGHKADVPFAAHAVTSRVAKWQSAQEDFRRLAATPPPMERFEREAHHTFRVLPSSCRFDDVTHRLFRPIIQRRLAALGGVPRAVRATHTQ
jgi:hypothetical protein